MALAVGTGACPGPLQMGILGVPKDVRYIGHAAFGVTSMDSLDFGVCVLTCMMLYVHLCEYHELESLLVVIAAVVIVTLSSLWLLVASWMWTLLMQASLACGLVTRMACKSALPFWQGACSTFSRQFLTYFQDISFLV